MTRDAKHHAATSDLGTLESSRTKLQTAANELERFLFTGPAENAEAWKRYLKWEDLRDAIDLGSAARVSKVNGVLLKFRSGAMGLEKSRFVAVRKQLRAFLEQLTLLDTAPDRRRSAQLELRQSLELLEQFLSTAPEKREKGWKEYLKWNDLLELMDADERSVRPFVPILRQYVSETPGLEHQRFRRAAAALSKYMEVLQLDRRAGAAETLDARLEQIARDIEKDALDRSNVTTATLLRHLEWLRSYGQLPEIEGRLIGRFSAPNLHMHVSEDLVRRVLTDSRTQSDPVGMWFFGSWVSGTSTGTANIMPRLEPSFDRAAILLDVTGQGTADTVGVKRRVSVYSHGDVQMMAQKKLFFDGFQITTEPAWASACSQNRTCGVSVDRLIGRRLIGRLARRRARKLNPCAEQLSNCQAREKLQQQMDSRADEMIQKANEQLADLRSRLEAQDLFPSSLHLSSSTNAIQMVAKLLAGGEFLAPNAPPLVPNNGDVTLQFHQSLLNNALAKQFGGLKIDNESIVERMQAMNLEIPSELQGGGDENEDEDEPWSMQFDFERPVSFGFDDGLVSITVRGNRFTRGDQQIKDTIDITAQYQFVYASGDLFVRRVGDVAINFVGTEGQLSTRQMTYKTFLGRRVSALFRDRLSLDDVPSGQIPDEVRNTLPKSIYVRDGWMTVGLDISDEMLRAAQIGS